MMFVDTLIKLCGWIYNMIVQLYNAFLKLARVNLFGGDNESLLIELVHRIYYVVGVAMLFILAYSILRQIVNPEQKDKSSGFKMVVAVIKAVVAIALVPTVFGMAFDIQDAIFRKNTIGKIIIGTDQNQYLSGKGVTPSQIVNNGGNTIAVVVFQTFFYPKSTACDPIANDPDATDEAYNNCINGATAGRDDGKTYKEVIDEVKKTGDFEIFAGYPDSYVGANSKKDPHIVFNPIFALICGGFCVYMLLSFCISLGVRLFKLVAYEILAPVAAILDCVPGSSGTFSKWLKATATTFAEAMLRVAILFFVVYLVYIIEEGNVLGQIITRDILGHSLLKVRLFDNLLIMKVYKDHVEGLIRAFMIMGLMLFGKQFPKLISEVTGIDSKNMSMGLKDQLKSAGVFTAAGVIGGAGVAAARGGIRGIKGGVGYASQRYRTTKGKTGADLKETRKNNAKAIAGGIAGAVFGAAGRGLAGGLSGGVHGFDKGADGIGSVRKAAKKGYDTASERAAGRAGYKAKHGGTFLGAAGGRIADAGRKVGDFLGLTGVEAYEKENEVLGKVASAQSKLKGSAFALIDDQIAKFGANSFLSNGSVMDTDVATRYGNVLALADDIANAKNAKSSTISTGATVVDAERQLGKMKKELSDVIQQQFALMSDKEWAAWIQKSDDHRGAAVDMNDVRVDAAALKEAFADGLASSSLVASIRKNVGDIALVKEALEKGQANQADILKELKNAVPEIVNENNEKIFKYNKAREKEEKK